MLYWKNKKKQDEEYPFEIGLFFKVDKEDNMICEILVNNDSNEMAAKYGQMLYLLNYGQMIDLVLDTLGELSKEKKEFTEISLATFNQLQQEVTINNPIVRPSQVFDVEPSE